MSGRYKAYGEYKDSGVEWLGEIPREWSVLMGKRIFSSIRKTALKDDVQLAVSQKYGVLPQSLMMLLNDSKVMLALKGTDSFRHVDQNDFVISLRSFEGGIEYSKYSGCVSPAYTVLNNVKKISHNYYKYLLKCAPFISALQSTTDSLRDGKSISYEQFGAICLPLTRLSEQTQIATFLDHETAKIDTLIDKQQQLIELLKEKRQAVISHAVTKGLDPDVPMKDSGVEWLGEVPEHWIIQKIKWFATMKSGDFITSESIEIEDEFPVYGGNGLRGYSKRYTHDGKYVLIGRQGALCGNINYANGKFWASEHAVVVSPYGNNEVIWLGELFGFMNFNQYSFSAAQPGLAVERIKDLHIPIPPSSEQKLISRFLDFEIQLFESIKDKCNQSITLLQERRTALISAAVTGKIDVRDWQVPVTQTESDEVMA